MWLDCSYTVFRPCLHIVFTVISPDDVFLMYPQCFHIVANVKLAFIYFLGLYIVSTAFLPSFQQCLHNFHSFTVGITIQYLYIASTVFRQCLHNVFTLFSFHVTSTVLLQCFYCFLSVSHRGITLIAHCFDILKQQFSHNICIVFTFYVRNFVKFFPKCKSQSPEFTYTIASTVHTYMVFPRYLCVAIKKMFLVFTHCSLNVCSSCHSVSTVFHSILQCFHNVSTVCLNCNFSISQFRECSCFDVCISFLQYSTVYYSVSTVCSNCNSSFFTVSPVFLF